MRQLAFVIGHRAETAHVEPVAAGFAFVEIIGLVDRLHADAIEQDRAAVNCGLHWQCIAAF
jgi:hypothetical protein